MDGGPAATLPALSIAGWLRAARRIAALLALLIACVPAYYLWRLRGPHNPWPRRFLRNVLRASGIGLRTTGRLPAAGSVLLANHLSWIDIPALAGATGTAFVAHDGLAGVPLVRWLCRMNDTVFIARSDRGSVATQVAQVREAIDDTGALTIFPEGTTSGGAALLPFKSSLLSALDSPPPGLAVQPVWLDYGTEAEAIAWVGAEHGLHNFLRILGLARPPVVTLHFLEPLSGPQLASRKTIAAAAQAAIAGAMDAQAMPPAAGPQRVAL